MDMLNPDKNKLIIISNIILYFFLVSCNTSSKEQDLIQFSESKIGCKKYLEIYNKANDSISAWVLNDLDNYTMKYQQSYKLDSLLCFNSQLNRFIAAIHCYRNVSTPSDELCYFVGEMINNKWYFFLTSETVTLPRKMYLKTEVIPLTYQQLHEIALKEVFSPYLKPNGEINEEWFIKKFEGPGWGSMEDQSYFDWCFKGKRYSNKKEFYEANHLCKVKRNWMDRDTTKPIIPLPSKEVKLP